MVKALLEEGIRAHDNGDRGKAATCYRRILESRPRHSDAIYLLGVIDYQEGRLESAGEAIRKAIRIQSKTPYYYYYLGLVEAGAGRKQQAISFWQKGVRLDRKLVPFYEELAKTLFECGEPETALNWAKRGRREAPDNVKLKNFESIARFELGEYDRAEALLLEVLDQQFDYPEAWNNLGNCYYIRDAWKDAEDAYRQAIELSPGFAEAWSGLGDTMRRQNRLDEALAALDEAHEADPECGLAWLNRGTVYQIRGQMRDAEAVYQKALLLEPKKQELFSNYLFSLMYREDVTPAYIYELHREYGERFRPERLIPPRPPKAADRDRKLRVGLASSDFKWHSVTYFLISFLKHYDRDQFEVFAYSSARKEDDKTDEIRGLVDHFILCNGMKDPVMVEQIRKDRIDILVDLSGHTELNRLPVFANKPAPVQVSWLGYPGTTGVDAIDYRLVDAITEPPEGFSEFSSETLYPLPDGFHCYTPRDGTPEPADPPSMAKGTLTFGSFNYLGKVTGEVVATWAEILKAVPGSRILLKSHILDDRSVRDHIYDRFAAAGIPRERILARGFTETVLEHLGVYSEVDLALDPFPYNGTTTTCEALWMGVPVITLQGERHAARVGASLLSQVGRPEWIANDRGSYVERAVTLATDPEALLQARRTLRPAMAACPLRDEVGFTRKLTTAFRDMWERHLDAAGV